MRCPSCHDEYEDGVRVCAECRVPLVHDDDVVASGAEPPVAEAGASMVPLGRFHPLVAERIGELLTRRGIEHETLTEQDSVRVVVSRRWRDDLRAEFALTWNDVLRHLPEERVGEVITEDEDTPGWYDPPRGGYIDREGRLVVEAAEGDDEDAARVIGPAVFTLGAVLVVAGWLVIDATAVVVAGVGLAVVGLLLPR